jgi:hypothetical protein
MRIANASSRQTVNPFGLQQSGTPLATANVADARAVAVRQWVHGPGPVAAGPLPEGIFAVIDRAADYPSESDAHTLLADLSKGFGSAPAQPVAGIPGANVLSAPFAFNVPGGQVTGHEELVTIERGAEVFTVLLVGGGSRPTASDARTVAALQVAALPASLS